MASRFGPAYVKGIIRHNSVRKGLMGGNRFWLAIFVARFLTRWSRKVTKRGEKPIRFSESLKPGESFVIRHVGSSE
jgi:hypothetical protein